MPAIVLGSAALTWDAGTADPAAIGVTVPVGTKLAILFTAYFAAAAGNGISTATLNSVSRDLLHQTLTAPTNLSSTSIAIWKDPAPGSVNVDVSWSALPTEGPTSAIAFIGDSEWPLRDFDSAANESANANSVTLDTRVDDLVLMFDQHFNTAESIPATPAGFTSLETVGQVDEGARLSYRYATASTQACTSQDLQYSTVAAVSIAALTKARAVDPRRLLIDNEPDSGKFNELNINGWFRTAGGLFCPT